MKRDTAIRAAKTVAERISKCGGIIETPDGIFAAVRVRALWLFGSTLIRSATPADVDLLWDIESVGEARSARRGEVPPDKRQLRNHGTIIGRSSSELAILQLRRGLRLVKFHLYEIDKDIALPRRALWPVDEFDPHEEITAAVKRELKAP